MKNPITQSKKNFMKKLFTLLWLSLAAFTIKATAQGGGNCNPEFTYQFLNSSLVRFIPAVNDSPAVQHSWNFGDGSTVSHTVSPTHNYALPGTYNVLHTVVRHNPNGGTECTESLTKQLTIPPPCNLVVDFSWNATNANSLTIEFHNLSTPLGTNDSTTWSFGDGSTSYVTNPLHTYAHAGTYNVCLVVKKNNPPGTPPCIRYICKTITVTTPCNLVVDFSSAPATGNPLEIHFINLSTPLGSNDSTTWTFGDGSTSFAVNPVHIYAHAGTYTVCLVVKKNNAAGTPPCIRYLCKTITVTEPCNLQANFTWRADSVNAQKIWFTNTSLPLNNTDSMHWTFGDGTTSSLVSPDHTYAQPGTYTVCLRVQKRGPAGIVINCVSETCKTLVVYPTCNFQANYTWQLDPQNNNRVNFTNTTNVPPLNATVNWYFGDGSSATTWNASHEYAHPGRYYVCLRIQLSTNCVRYKCDSITIPEPCNFQPSYTWQLDSINSNKVHFTNTTNAGSNTASAIWSFGDGATATTWNAVHEYAHPGRYYVCLRVQLSTNCVRYKCDSITVQPPCNSNSNFYFVVAPTNSQTYVFTPVYQNSAFQYIWTFGDGSGSTSMITTHHYAHAGNYTACLTVIVNHNCTSTTCKTVVVTGQVNCDSIHVTYTYQHDPVIPNKIYFYAVANYIILDQTWTITSLNGGTPPVILHQNNPVYVFRDTGLYRVCLNVVTLGGCTKEYCTQIHIEHVTQQCTLQAYPNPASTSVNVNVSLSTPTLINVYVYNTLNVLVLDKHQQGVVGNNVVNLNVSGLISGFYTMRVIYGNNNCYSAFQKL